MRSVRYGGEPLVDAPLIALAYLAPLPAYAGILGFFVVGGLVHHGRRSGASRAVRAVGTWATGGIVGVAVAHGTAPILHATRPATAGSTVIVIVVATTALGYLGAGWVNRWATRRGSPLETWPVELSLACGAALLALAYVAGGALLACAALLPLLVSRFASERYAAAHDVYRQTVQALAVVPEVAGLVALGHGERSSVYARALAGELHLSQGARDTVALAARLHHVGALAAGTDEELSFLVTGDAARQGAGVLRRTGLLRDVADVVGAIEPDPACPPAEAALRQQAAIVRVASDLDDLVGEDAGRLQWATTLLGQRLPDDTTAAAVAALRRIVHRQPWLAAEAIGAGATITGPAERALREPATHGSAG